MWNRIKEWLLKSECQRLQAMLDERFMDLEHEKDRWMLEYCNRRETLEAQYAMIKQHNDHLMKLLVDQKMLDPVPPMIVKKNSVN